MKSVESDVVILGGGCAAVWVSYELARRGFAPLIVEHGSFGQYASQRNQGWLHTGSLYTAIMNDFPSNGGQEMIRLAKACLKSSLSLRKFAQRHAPEALYLKSRCLYLYERREQADLVAGRLKEIGIEPRVWSGNLGGREPILSGSRVTVALETPDVPMNCGTLLRAVLRLSMNGGTRALNAPTSLSNSQIRRAGGGGGNSIGKTLTCASNAASEASIANGLHNLGIGKSSVGNFVNNALAGNAFSGLTDLVKSLFTGEGGGHSTFYNMAQGIVAGPTQGFGAAANMAGYSLEGSPWGSGPADVATNAIASTSFAAVTGANASIQTINSATSIGTATSEQAISFATGVGEAKLAYDFGSWLASVGECAIGAAGH